MQACLLWRSVVWNLGQQRDHPDERAGSCGRASQASNQVEPVPAVAHSQQFAGQAALSDRATLESNLFKLTHPQSNGELILWDSTPEQGLRCGKACLPDTEDHKGLNWGQNLAKHNEEFNPSGRSAKRQAEIPIDQPLGTLFSNARLL